MQNSELLKFQTFFQNKIYNDLIPLEQKRKVWKNKIEAQKKQSKRLSLIYPLIVLVVSVFTYFIFDVDITALVGVTLFFALIGTFLPSETKLLPSEGLQSDFKQIVIDRTISYIDNRFYYHPEEHITLGEVKRSCLFLQECTTLNNHSGQSSSINLVKGGDLIFSAIGDNQIRLSEISGYGLSEGSDGIKPERKVFQGLFLVSKGTFSLKGVTQVFPKKSFYYEINIAADRGEPIQMDEPNFNQHFVVYGTDLIETHYILSILEMQEIIDFAQQTGVWPAFSFIANEIFVAMRVGENFLEPKVDHSLLEFETIRDYFLDLNFVLDIAKSLDKKLISLQS